MTNHTPLQGNSCNADPLLGIGPYLNGRELASFKGASRYTKQIAEAAETAAYQKAVRTTLRPAVFQQATAELNGPWQTREEKQKQVVEHVTTQLDASRHYLSDEEWREYGFDPAIPASHLTIPERARMGTLIEKAKAANLVKYFPLISHQIPEAKAFVESLPPQDSDFRKAQKIRAWMRENAGRLAVIRDFKSAWERDEANNCRFPELRDLFYEGNYPIEFLSLPGFVDVEELFHSVFLRGQQDQFNAIQQDPKFLNMDLDTFLRLFRIACLGGDLNIFDAMRQDARFEQMTPLWLVEAMEGSIENPIAFNYLMAHPLFEQLSLDGCYYLLLDVSQWGTAEMMSKMLNSHLGKGFSIDQLKEAYSRFASFNDPKITAQLALALLKKKSFWTKPLCDRFPFRPALAATTAIATTAVTVSLALRYLAHSDS